MIVLTLRLDAAFGLRTSMGVDWVPALVVSGAIRLLRRPLAAREGALGRLGESALDRLGEADLLRGLDLSRDEIDMSRTGLGLSWDCAAAVLLRVRIGALPRGVDPREMGEEDGARTTARLIAGEANGPGAVQGLLTTQAVLWLMSLVALGG